MNSIIDQILGMVGKVGSLFGEHTKLSIGGPIITGAIVIFLLWKFWRKLPLVVKIILIIVALAVFSGGISNILGYIKYLADKAADVSKEILDAGAKAIDTITQ